MTTNINFNPNVTTNAPYQFLSTTEGWVQGSMWDDPNSIQWLTTGYINSSVSQPVWAGLPITETSILTSGTTSNLGSSLVLATAQTNITAWTVANQAYNMLITPGNNVQVALANMTVSYVRAGSNARIVVAVDSAAISALTNVATNTAVYWDFTNNALNSSGTGALPVKFLGLNSNSKIVSYNSGTGAVTWTTGTAALIQV